MEHETGDSYDSDDHIGVIVASGVWTIEYDIQQVQEDGYAEYTVDVFDDGRVFETDDMSIGDRISLIVARDAIDRLGQIYGFIVPDHLLGLFIEEFPALEIHRR